MLIKSLSVLIIGNFLKFPAYVINVLVYWYLEQRLCVKWDGMTSNEFSVCNGINQGGILSPKLLNIYVNLLSQQLNKVIVGCYINGKVFLSSILRRRPTVDFAEYTRDAKVWKYVSKYGMKFNENKSVVPNLKI